MGGSDTAFELNSAMDVATCGENRSPQSFRTAALNKGGHHGEESAHKCGLLLNECFVLVYSENMSAQPSSQKSDCDIWIKSKHL